MLYLQKDQESKKPLDQAFDAFDDADREYSEDPCPATFQRRRLAMNRVSELLLEKEQSENHDPMLDHLASLLTKMSRLQTTRR